jgi:heparin binding hemagglutinin HbhA
MALTFPTKFDVREARDQAVRTVSAAVDPLRAPSLAVLGLGDVALAAARDALARAQAGVDDTAARVEELPAELENLRHRLSVEEFRRLAEAYVGAVRSVYADLIGRGESAYSQIVAQPQVKRALDLVNQVSGELESRLEDTVEDGRVRAEKTLADVTRETRSVGERAARATQRGAAQAAATVEQTSSELAAEIDEAGDELASETRSVTRRTAARTAPTKQGPKNAPTHSATTSAQKRGNGRTS